MSADASWQAASVLVPVPMLVLVLVLEPQSQMLTSTVLARAALRSAVEAILRAPTELPILALSTQTQTRHLCTRHLCMRHLWVHSRSAPSTRLRSAEPEPRHPSAALDPRGVRCRPSGCEATQHVHVRPRQLARSRR